LNPLEQVERLILVVNDLKVKNCISEQQSYFIREDELKLLDIFLQFG